MLRILYLAAISWDCSVSTFAKRIRLAISDETCEKTGAIILQGPHHAAQKSTTTGRSFLPIKRSKFSPDRLTGLPSSTGLWHFPQTGLSPRRDAGTRFIPLQLGQTICTAVIFFSCNVLLYKMPSHAQKSSPVLCYQPQIVTPLC